MPEYFMGKTNINDWQQAALPNWDNLIELIEKAKGNRSAEEFAKLCGSNGPKFSRILNRKIKRPLEPELLEAISDNAENFEVPISALLLADGYRPKAGTIAETQLNQVNNKKELQKEKNVINEVVDKPINPVRIVKKKEPDGNEKMERYYSRMVGRNNDPYSNSKSATVSRVMRVRDILTSELMDRDSGVSVDIGRDATRDTDCLKGSGYLPHWDLRFNTRAYSEFRGWYVHVISKVVKPSSSDLTFWMACNDALKDMACYFTTDAWQPELFNKFKCTFAFVDEKIYSGVKQKLNYAKTNNCFTVMLIDLSLRVVKEEVSIGSKNEWSDILLADIPEQDFYSYYEPEGQLSFEDLGYGINVSEKPYTPDSTKKVNSQEKNKDNDLQ